MAERILIVNADDFGRSDAINEGVTAAHRSGIVTSASLMVRWPAAVPATAASAGLDLGLHLDLGEWILRDGEWVPVYEVAELDDPAAIEDEVRRQIHAFRDLTGRNPTHLDSHQHVHMREPVTAIARCAAHALGVPLRAQTGGIRYCGSFYGQDRHGNTHPDSISADNLIRLIRAVDPGVTEISCHPARRAEGVGGYDKERPLELMALCDPRVRMTVDDAGVRLASFLGARGGQTDGRGATITTLSADTAPESG